MRLFNFLQFRPSGTEDCVRVYAEAVDERSVDDIASRVGRLVYEKCGGKD